MRVNPLAFSGKLIIVNGLTASSREITRKGLQINAHTRFCSGKSFWKLKIFLFVLVGYRVFLMKGVRWETRVRDIQIMVWTPPSKIVR